ncbi:hypothetical protein BRADI_3g56980v3 [Brachypodium distachyon]|uniref:Uncharacterized protein n=1 Tax=Brachypodium distachyon TaxID=15368 RepID=A0A2K2D5F6_BRADI|nr:hypothetical protein BRADI_3g56980v3 [Brachypodium distachyon]
MKNRKGRRSRNKATCNEAATSNGDRFSTLPDDILLNVLERVETLDALRTCILSKRMLKLPTMLSHIDVDIYSLAYYGSFRDLVRINGAVADVTENILSTRSPEIPIRKLKVRFVLRHYDFLSIVKSFARAMATQKVEKAEIEIMTEKIKYQYCTPADRLDSAKKFNTILDACPDAFPGLTSLWLHNMSFGELDIPNILSTCKRLQSFHLTYCDTGTRSVLQIEHDQLIELEIDYGKFETVKLTYLPKLQQVSYNNWCYEDQPLSFGFVPQLSKLSLTRTAVRSDRALELSQVLANFPSISELHLDFQSEKSLFAASPKFLICFFHPRFGFYQNARNCLRLCLANYGLWIWTIFLKDVILLGQCSFFKLHPSLRSYASQYGIIGATW